MKAALLYGKKDLRVVNIDKPRISDEEILVKVKANGVCPTDIRKFLTGNHGVRNLPMNLGHEWAGEIVEVGDNITEFSEGMRVTSLGMRGYAEYAKIDKRMIEADAVNRLPDNVSYEEATFTEPLSDCWHCVVERARVKLGDIIAIIGAGPMGLLNLMVAKATGAKVIVSELVEDRLNYAEKLGADFVVNPSREDPVETVKKLSDGKGVESVIVSISQQEAIEQGLKMVKAGGTVVLFGGAIEGIIARFDPNLIHYGEVTLTGSTFIGIPPNFKILKKSLDLISSKRIPVGKLITHRFPLDQIHKAFEVVIRKEGLKVIVNP